MRKPEQDFLKFCRKGDSRALARVFDRLAPELLLLALHLTGDHSRAEDLIQETFLRAMEAADRFHHGSPLRPWLVGILTNTAREARRAQARSGEPSPVAAPADEGPVDCAQNHEFAEHLERVVESLPTTYHQVLILRLSKGMSAVEIAHTLGRPPKTVQTQMRRGMDLLRKALPGGLTVPIALVSLPGRGLSAVREVVMERAVSSVGTAVGIGLALGPLLLLGKIMIPVLLLGGLGYFAVSELSVGAVAGLPGMLAEDATSTTLAPVADASDRETESQDSVGEQDRTRLAASASSTVVRGRLVAAETGHPVAGGIVRLIGWVRNSEREALYGDAPNLDLEDFVTGADGLFELAFSPHPAHGFLLDVSTDGRATMRRQWDQLAAGDIVELGDVSLPLGASVQGRFTDEQGVPVADLRLQVRQAGLKVPGSTDIYPKEFAYSTRSGSDGSFVGVEPLVAGAWEVSFSTREYQLVGPDRLVVAGGDEIARLDVIVRSLPKQPTISGLVVDESGLPVSGMALHTVSGRFGFPGSRGSSGAGGLFTIYREGEDESLVRIEEDPISASNFAMIPADLEYEWGVDDVRIVVQHPVTVNLQVVEAGTRIPVEDFSVRHFPMPQIGSQMTKMRLRGNHQHGRVVLEDVRVGRNALIVYPLDEDLVASEPVEFEVGSAGTGLRVEVHRRQPLTVLVQRGDGSPVVGTEIELLRKEGRGDLRVDTISGLPYQAYSGFSGTVMAIVLDAGVTDAEGRVVLSGPLSRGGLAIKAKGPGYTPRLATGVSLEPRNPPFLFRVSSGATVHGRLEPVAALEDLGPAKMREEVLARLGPNRIDRYRPGVFLRDPDSGQRYPVRTTDGVPVDRDGTFLLEGIPPGSWDVYLHHVQPGGGNADRRLGILARLQDEEHRDIRLGIAHLRPGTLNGRVFLDGEVYADQTVQLRWSEPGVDGWRSRNDIETDAEGRFSVEVAPGSQQLLVNLNTTYGAPIVSAEVAHVPGGEMVDRVFNLVRAKMRLRILESDGTPATERLFWIHGMVMSLNQSAARTDQEGWLVIDPAPSEPVTLTTWSLGLDEDAIMQLPVHERQPLLITLGPVQLPPGQKDVEFVLQLKEKE